MPDNAAVFVISDHGSTPVPDKLPKYLSELRRKFPNELMAALVREVTTIWRAVFDRMVQAFPAQNS
jgi:hypothetical protein